MFAVSDASLSLSPRVMRFSDLWIYDLHALHPYTQAKTLQSKEVFAGSSVWALVLKAYGLHLFSDTEELRPFAQDYFQRFHPGKVSKKQFENTFAIFRRLGLVKMGHLRKLPYHEIIPRFGKVWADFLKGITSPDQATWPWQAFVIQEPLIAEAEFETLTTDYQQVLHSCRALFEKISKATPSFTTHRLHLHLILYDLDQDVELPFYFAHPYSIRRDSEWILRLFEERLLELELPAPLWKIHLWIHPAPMIQDNQLSLFHRKETPHALRDLCQKLQEQGFEPFQPELLPSQIPENSWRKGSPLSTPRFSTETPGLIRPLWQYQKPQKLCSPPHGVLHFTERVAGVNPSGQTFKRDYYMYHQKGGWRWIFQNEQSLWFEQGSVD